MLPRMPAPTGVIITSGTFQSPPLDPGRNYTYEVRARWTEDAKEVSQTRKVRVRIGQRVTVDFTRPEPQPEDLPGTPDGPDKKPVKPDDLPAAPRKPATRPVKVGEQP